MRRGVAQACEGSDVKRRLVIVAIFLLAGAVVNVGVAWGCAAWSPFQRQRSMTSHEISMRLVSAEHAANNTNLAGLWTGFCFEGWGIDCYCIYGPRPPQPYVLAVWRAGVPLRTLYGKWIRHSSGLNKSGIIGPPEISNPAVRSMVPTRQIPYKPLLAGFTINTLFYAALLWLPIPGPFALRRFLRVRRGRCPKCKYPMGESAVCSECGAELPKRTRAAT